MKRVFNKEQIFTIPNLLSVIRLTMVPLILWSYIHLEAYYLTIAFVVLSALTDVADGLIARKFDMISDFGKILDPLADKVTQIALLCCLMSRYRLMKLMIAVFLIREFCMAIMGYLALKQNSINSAKWYGKMNTTILYLVIAVLVLFPGIQASTADKLIWGCIISLVVSLFLYMNFYFGLFRSRKRAQR